VILAPSHGEVADVEQIILGRGVASASQVAAARALAGRSTVVAG